MDSSIRTLANKLKQYCEQPKAVDTN